MAKEYPIEKLKNIIHYEPETGKLYWKPRDMDMFSYTKNPTAVYNGWCSKYLGNEIGSINGDGYVLLEIRGRGIKKRNSFKAHRVAWALHYGEWPNGHIDHINGIRNDNRITNLRVVTNSENQRNIALKRNNTSGVMGVSYVKKSKKWVSRIKVEGKNIYLGVFENFEEAVSVRKAAESKYGFHENHGRPRLTN